MNNKYWKFNVVMVLCFVVGGFSILFYFLQLYSSFWGFETFGATRFENNSTFNRSFRSDEFNRTPGRLLLPSEPITNLTSPFSIILLFSGITSLLGGISIGSLTREKELMFTKEKITSLLLLPEEKMVIEELKKFNGDITHSQLVKRTGLSKVRIHRIVNKLVSKGIIKKYQYGLTNKIVLEKDF